MALEATHIRFALSIMNDYKIIDEKEYILGTSYPDSRYTTGIQRESTHGEYILKEGFATDDFKRGWQAHAICDLIQYEAFKKFIPLLSKHGKEWTDEKWIDFTTVKIIQDILDRQSYKIVLYLPYLEKAENPNGEDVEQIIKYNRSLIELYEGEISMPSYCKTLIDVGVKEDLAIITLKRAEALMQNDELILEIKRIFPYMVENYKKNKKSLN